MSKSPAELAAERAATVRARLLHDLRTLCADAGISIRELSRASGVPNGYLARVFQGEAQPSLETYAKLGGPLGADLSARLYPNTGPEIRDRHQAGILEWLLGVLHPRWRPFSEVRVWQPSKGWIDAVLHEARATLAVATEIESELRRLEQQVRWHEEKALALPSWRDWEELGEPAISRLLIVRRTRATRAVAREFARQLALAFPAHPDDAMAALTGTTPWPGPALVWVTVDKRGVRFAPGR
ncbi:MAG: helix-turn-helix transcriptional regulator [Chloroflexi bacterium]|nr:helix-turn-helix transcriptional regulator [Chloroflexota bacterium]